MAEPVSPAPQPVRTAPAGAFPADRVGLRLAAFGAVLVVLLSIGFVVGRLTGGPDPRGPAAADTNGHTREGGHGHGTGGTTSADAAPHDEAGTAPHVHNSDGTAAATAGDAAPSVGGLAVTAAGLTLVPRSTTVRVGGRQPWQFHIAGADGRPVTGFAVVHDKPLHLVVVRRDLSGYQHLHPTMSPDGTWSTDLTVDAAGPWRAYADFTAVAGGVQTPVTLGFDLNAAGQYTPAALPAPSRTTTVAGFTVAYDGAPRTGATQPLLVRVTGADGRPAALQPYLGALGHLVVLREGDLGYVHVHPEPEPADGAVKFWLAAPGPGRYRMFFDFQVDGRVHTAAFTATVN